MTTMSVPSRNSVRDRLRAKTRPFLVASGGQLVGPAQNPEAWVRGTKVQPTEVSYCLLRDAIFARIAKW
jgi:hypothetical protein